MNYIIDGKQYLKTKIIISAFMALYCSICSAMDVPIYDFSITPYSQNASDYLSPDDEQYNKPLLKLEYQKSQLKQFYNHYYSTDPQGLSPWNEQLVTSILPIMKKIEPEVLDEFNNQNKASENKHFAENFKEHDQIWWSKISDNMDVYALTSSEFKEENRAISVTNTLARALPDLAPDFFHTSLPGQGFPFDNLQESAIWAGTPLYVFSTSKDKAWSLILTPDAYFAWVKSSDIAYVSIAFINQWQAAAQQKLVAVTETDAAIIDTHQRFQFTGYIGAVFPMVQRTSQQTSLFIPIKKRNNQAVIKIGIINTQSSRIMPLAASPHNMMTILRQLQNRPYGWGGAFFFNDCSQEMKSLFTPFGIWLPRNSAQQSQLSSTLNLSKNNVDDRIKTLKEKGHPLMTLIFIGSHIMLYVGNKNMDNHDIEAITYQNVWGLSPANHDKRYVIGQSLFFPLLNHYPENPEISSLAEKTYFKLVYLDELTLKSDSPQAYANKFMDWVS